MMSDLSQLIDREVVAVGLAVRLENADPASEGAHDLNSGRKTRRPFSLLSNRSGANCVNLGSAGQRRWAAGAPTGAALAAAAYPFAVAFAARFAPLRPHRRVRSWTRVLAWVARSRGAPTPRARSSVKNKAKRSRSSRSWRSCCWTRSLSTAAALRLVGRSHQAPWGAVSPPLPP